jgi:hypothetical protein
MKDITKRLRVTNAKLGKNTIEYEEEKVDKSDKGKEAEDLNPFSKRVTFSLPE